MKFKINKDWVITPFQAEPDEYMWNNFWSVGVKKFLGIKYLEYKRMKRVK